MRTRPSRNVVMRWDNVVVCALVAPTLYACSRDADVYTPLELPSPVLIRAIQPLHRDPLGALVQHDATHRFLIRVRYSLPDLSEIGFTPWQGADSSILVLGLKAGQTYSM